MRNPSIIRAVSLCSGPYQQSGTGTGIAIGIGQMLPCYRT